MNIIILLDLITFECYLHSSRLIVLIIDKEIAEISDRVRVAQGVAYGKQQEKAMAFVSKEKEENNIESHYE